MDTETECSSNLSFCTGNRVEIDSQSQPLGEYDRIAELREVTKTKGSANAVKAGY